MRAAILLTVCAIATGCRGAGPTPGDLGVGDDLATSSDLGDLGDDDLADVPDAAGPPGAMDDLAEAGDLAGVTLDLATAPADLGLPPAVPSTYFGMQSVPKNGIAPTVPFASYRLWDGGVSWATLNPSSGVYDFGALDTLLHAVKLAGIDDGVIYTFGVTPTWASPHADDVHCDFDAAGGCWLPTDLADDGSGTNATYLAFVRALAQHVNDPTYLTTHAHIRYWEPWNEWWRNPELGTLYKNCQVGGHCSVHATYAQMVRMTEDLRCAIAGKVGNAACGAVAIDPTARILPPSGEPRNTFGVQMMENFLHCDAGAPATSKCTTFDRGRAAVDVLSFHFYAQTTERADDLDVEVARVRAGLRAADLAALPLWNGEGGWGLDSDLTDVDLRAAFVAQYFLLGLSNGLAVNVWYEFDNQGWGTMYTGGALDATGIAYEAVHGWMNKRSLVAPCATTGTRRTCSFVGPSGFAGEALWDPAQGCSAGTCTTVSVPVAASWLHYRDVAGNLHVITNHAVPVGAKPIWLENQ